MDSEQRERPLRRQTWNSDRPSRRRATALLTAIFVMAVTSQLVISIVDTQVIQYAVLRNTLDYDRARYLAEAGLQHAFAELEQDIEWRDGVLSTEFPADSGNTYTATAEDGPAGTVIVTARGAAGRFTRTLQTSVKMGG